MADLSRTRRSLHGVAELLLAGPQHRRIGTIRLRVTDDGFATVADPVLAVTGVLLVTPAGSFPLDGATGATLGASAGLDVGAAAGVYQEGSGVGPEEPLRVDPEAASELLAGLARGGRALRRFAPEETPVLWPEHFDVGITVEEVNYGVSPGDSYLDEPYAYVGPWAARTGEFWNAPFGAARPLRELPGDALDSFFGRGRSLAHD